jgi:hypothetical protein
MVCTWLLRRASTYIEAGIAKADIETFYDSLNMILVALWLQDHGLAKADCARVVRLQLLPRLVLHIGGAKAIFKCRACGSLTGSRVAGALGRVPVEDTMSRRWRFWQSFGFHFW